MKRKYAVTMDEKVVEAIRPKLKQSGISLSGFLNAAACEYYEIMREGGEIEDVAKMPVTDFLRKLKWMLSKMTEDEKEDGGGKGPRRKR